jgi:hypothetical protein
VKSPIHQTHATLAKLFYAGTIDKYANSAKGIIACNVIRRQEAALNALKLDVDNAYLAVLSALLHFVLAQIIILKTKMGDAMDALSLRNNKDKKLKGYYKLNLDRHMELVCF